MNFDQKIDRRGTHSVKWDSMESIYGVSPDDGISMWVADMEFQPPQCVQDAIKKMHDHGVYGYFGDETAYKEAIRWWMDTRHNWQIDPSWVFTTHGLVNGTGLCVDAYTAPGDGVVLFTPVYHAFARVIKAADRQVVECELVNNNGRYEMDFDAYDAQMTGNETMLILCSPHNPGGRVWSKGELQAVAAFAKRHDLILVSDEIHHDLVYSGNTHIPMANLSGIEDRLVMMTATTKTFNIAGSHSGNVIIPDEKLRGEFGAVKAGPEDIDRHLRALAGDRAQIAALHPRPEEGAVPLVVLQGEAGAPAFTPGGAASHYMIAPTLLAAMGYDREAVRARSGGALDEPSRDPATFNYLYNARLNREPRWRVVDPTALAPVPDDPDTGRPF